MKTQSVLLTGLALGLTLAAGAAPKAKPNVLFLFVDDLTYDGLAALGNREIHSPNMDGIVRSGVSFANTYNMGGWSGAISIASRSQLITGRYLWNTRRIEGDGYAGQLSGRELWPQVMKDAGYKTYMTGKWHMTAVRPEQVFDQVDLPRIGGMPKDTRKGYDRPRSPDDNVWLPWDKRRGGYWSEGEHWSEKQADVTVRYIEQNKDSKEPLFIYCAFNAPHDPRQSPEEFVDMYAVDEILLPVNYLPEHPCNEAMGAGRELRDERLAPFPRTPYAIRKHRQEYYALISHLDVQIGRILKALKESGMDKNTLIVLAADNGLAVGSHGLLGKQSMYDHSMKIPLVISGCGLPAGRVQKELVYLQDLVPTVYQITGIRKPAHVEFSSLLPVIQRKRGAKGRDAVYGAYLEKQRMVRDGRYKLFLIPEARKAYLFDLVADPHETNDLYGQSRYAETVRRLASRYVQLAAESGDTFDVAAFFPELFGTAGTTKN